MRLVLRSVCWRKLSPTFLQDVFGRRGSTESSNSPVIAQGNASILDVILLSSIFSQSLRSSEQNSSPFDVQEASSGREVRLVAVSKLKPASDILAIHKTTSHSHFGENYVSELQEKAKQLPDDIKWHFIGALQTNKCKILGAIPNLFAVETVDSCKKAELLEKSRASLALANIKPLEIYLQVNTSGESSKAGFLIEPNQTIRETQLYSTAFYIKEQCRFLKLAGLMTIGSIEESKSNNQNKDFEKLVSLRDQLSKSLNGFTLGLSMGMSADFILAIKVGSTNVRVGSSIFGERPPFKESQA
ncbi:hypothetical protein O181_050126 [Austropuccinia psidii MF-1]|uniref:Pyridoxal phosphate homeostasis protein n=1 Tax=Austropuccinia psidii MF-1 TaxID=1389203 RepID=A0A9Q3E187_9BASI|nr:hypothetical protein [Austropuccinia psidii MF-1]